jgi:hypothetical protein
MVCNWFTGNEGRSIEVSLSLDLAIGTIDPCGFLKLYKNCKCPIVPFRSDNCHECTGSVIYYARSN